MLMWSLSGPKNDGWCEYLRRTAGQYRWQNHSRGRHQRGHVHILQRVHQGEPKYTPFLALRFGTSCFLLWLWIKITVRKNILPVDWRKYVLALFKFGSHVFPVTVTDETYRMTSYFLDLLPRCWKRWTWNRRWAFDSCTKWQSRWLDRLAPKPIEKSKTLLPSPPYPFISTCWATNALRHMLFWVSGS